MGNFRRPMTKKAMQRKRITRGRKRQMTVVKNPVQSNATIVKLPYDGGSIGGTVSTVTSVYQFRTNSAFDPDFTSTGHQPLGYDQWRTLYLNYRVIGVYYDIHFHTASFASAVAGVYPHSSSTVPNLQQLMELPEVKQCTISNGYSKRIRGFISNPRLFGISSTEYKTNPNFTAGVSGNPPKDGFLTVFWTPLDEATNLIVEVRPRLTYVVEFYGRRALGGS